MTTIASGSAWCGHLTVTQEKQVGSNPIGAAKCSFFEHKLCEKRTFGFSKIDFVTQLVEYHTFNVRVMGSSPIGVTLSWRVNLDGDRDTLLRCFVPYGIWFDSIALRLEREKSFNFVWIMNTFLV